MTQDEYEVGSLENAEKFAIIRMAREAGLALTDHGHPEGYAMFCERLERFAALVAAHEREKHLNLANEVAWSVALAEREACAKVADEELMNTNMLTSYPPKSSAAWNIAAAIRARSKK